MAKVRLQFELDLDPRSVWITVTPSAAAKNAFLYVQEVGDFWARKKYYTLREGLPSYLIYCVLGGRGTLEYQGQTHMLHPGSFMWLDCMQRQFYRTAEDSDEWRILWVHFYGANSARYYEQFLALNNGSNMGELPPTNAVAANIRALIALYEAGHSTIGADIRASALLGTIMADLIASRGAGGEALTAAPECVRQARRYLTERYAERITLADLGQLYAIDKYYFQKLFKRHVGMTPNEFLILTRLTRAKELLRTTNRPIGEVAGEVGIINPSHFINLFKKHEGITPNVYRRNWWGK